jgi:hypothetical protein
LLAVFVLAPPAAAEPAEPPPSPAAGEDAARERALDLGEEALRYYDEGRWDEAYVRFGQADALAHAPTFVLYMARARRNAGRLLEARELYRAIVDEPLGTDAPEPFRKAHDRAATELGLTEARIPSLRIAVRGAAAARVRIDGEPVAVGARVEVDPGQHLAAATAGEMDAARRIDVRSDGAVHDLVFDLTPARSLPVPEADRSEPPVWPSALALGIGSAGFLLGIVTGAVAAAKTADVDCDAERCDAQDEADRAVARALAATATAGLAVGVAGVATGVVLWVTRPDPSAASVGALIHATF